MLWASSQNPLNYFSMSFSLMIFIFQVVVAFPDDGAWKRFHKQLDHFPMVS